MRPKNAKNRKNADNSIGDQVAIELAEAMKTNKTAPSIHLGCMSSASFYQLFILLHE